MSNRERYVAFQGISSLTISMSSNGITSYKLCDSILSIVCWVSCSVENDSQLMAIFVWWYMTMTHMEIGKTDRRKV